MDYLSVYIDLIEKGRDRILIYRFGYHLHHITPKSLGGEDTYNNLVFLTYKEHMLAHTLLAKLFPGQWMAVELIGLRTLKHLPKWKRRQIAYQRATNIRNANTLKLKR